MKVDIAVGQGQGNWHGEATVTVYPQEDAEPGGAWWGPEGAALLGDRTDVAPQGI